MIKNKSENKVRYALFSPLILFVFGLLIFNDMYLKYRFANVYTGKISDFAGLFLFPAWMEVLGHHVLKRHRSRVLIWGSGWGALIFTLAKTHAPTRDGIVIILNTITPFTHHIVLDPSDLLALPMLILGVLYCKRFFSQELT